MKNELNKRLITSFLLIIVLFLAIKYSYFFILTLLIIFVFSWIEFNNLISKIYKEKKDFFKRISLQFLVFIYLIFFIKTVINEYLFSYPSVSWVIIYVLLICIFTDVGGYLFGKTFKGKKLTSISPNKTYSGAFGSFLLSVILSLIYSFTISFVDFSLIVSLSILISFICQIGDLFISYLKRKAKLKDTGKILPGHGGILDRIDGILFAVPSGIYLINFYY